MRAEQLAHLNAELVRANSELAALATENATLYEREHEIASILQQSFLPAELPETAEFEFAALYQPSGEGIEVGGDFYDVFATPQGTAVVIGDVCGKGPAAARLTSLSRNTIRALATLAGERTASEILHRLNDAVIDQSGPAEYLTVTYILLASEQDGSATAAIASGGHLPPLVVRATGTVETVGAGAHHRRSHRMQKLERLDVRRKAIARCARPDRGEPVHRGNHTPGTNRGARHIQRGYRASRRSRDPCCALPRLGVKLCVRD